MIYKIPTELTRQLSYKIIRFLSVDQKLNITFEQNDKKTATKPSFPLLFTMDNKVFLGKDDDIEYE